MEEHPEKVDPRQARYSLLVTRPPRPRAYDAPVDGRLTAAVMAAE